MQCLLASLRFLHRYRSEIEFMKFRLSRRSGSSEGWGNYTSFHGPEASVMFSRSSSIKATINSKFWLFSRASHRIRRHDPFFSMNIPKTTINLSGNIWRGRAKQNNLHRFGTRHRTKETKWNIFHRQSSPALFCFITNINSVSGIITKCQFLPLLWFLPISAKNRCSLLSKQTILPLLEASPSRLCRI